ncbi:DUF6933 domain-containing protein [Vagococcus fluvialis]|uniref:DUF6933 domain-containing protein n=1 Tax=Vagococcus fluvialis TaxID=2738 RepID=UPI003B5AF034
MIIHATKKSLPLFSYLTPTENINEAKNRSNQNPLNSWHANYFNINRKKMLLLVNDASLYTILIPDVNANRKKELDELIFENLKYQLKTDGLPIKLAQSYLDQLGSIEVATGYNRKVISTSNHFILLLEDLIFSNNYATTPSKLASWLNKVPVSSLDYAYPVVELKAWLSGEKQPVTMKETLSNGKIAIEKKWDDFSLWKYRSEQVEVNRLNLLKLEDDFIEHSAQLMVGFRTYLESEEKLSDKVIKRHINNGEFFMDYLQSTTIYTPLSDDCDLMMYLYWLIDRYVITTDGEFNRHVTTLKKFYHFLFYVNEIDEKELRKKKEDIKDAKEIIFEL